MLQITVNGMTFTEGKDFDEAKVMIPTDQEPYWEIDLFLNGKIHKIIKATGKVTVIKTFEDKK